MHPFISIVIPARNAEATIGNCLKSLKELDYPRDKIEVIIADGLSTDRTRQLAEANGARVLTNPGITVVSGRNLGVKNAQGELIAFSDADCVMDKGWLKNCVKYFDDPRVAGIGGPNLVPEDEAAFGKAVGLLFDYAFSFGAGAPTKIYDKVIESRAHGSNAVYRADVLRHIMPIDEDMFEGEDVIMNQRIKQLGYKLLYVPDVIVQHHRRATPKKWWRQMYIYGLGKVLMTRKLSGTVTLPQFALGFTIPALIIVCILLAILNPLYLLAFVVGGTLVAATFLASFALLRTKSLAVALNMPLAAFILPIAWSYGFWRELLVPTRLQKSEAYK